MKMTIQIIKGQIIPHDDESRKQLAKLDDAIYVVDIKNGNMRTIKQNSALHKWCEMIAIDLNNSGLYIADIIKTESVWTMEKVKENIFKPVVESTYGKKSTTKLNKDEFEAVIDTITSAFGNKGITIREFPNKNNLE